MKKNAIAFVVALMSASTLLFAQGREDRGIRRDRTADEHFIASGRVSILSTEHAVIVSFDRDNERDSRGRQLQDIFVLQSDATTGIKVVGAQASVDYRGKELAIMTTDNRVFVLGLSDAASAPPKVPSARTMVKLVGYGLNHQLRPVEGLKHHALEFYGQVDTRGGGACDAGGFGSSSCSVGDSSGSCSISCTSGYHSCCNRVNQTCKCKKF